ncbi:cobyrinic acid a,c-diamide synthase [Geitlerinema sp. PCC 9228]|jgi:hypothetical protein|uniref:cobyrinic acid a,c-diamide synthase n=1 Tax=Geitlerinema sp. PCC 9228 TaxID=111611 RepID=UPI0008F99358|nr:cobyrinic acid a,c-diamide synthase [Geitlerinema sp. PCC 9228]
MLLPGERQSDRLWEKLPKEAKKWAENLPWEQRRYVLSLCHLLLASPPDKQAEFLDEYTADGLVSRSLADYDTKQKVLRYLQYFQIKTSLEESVMRDYIRQFYVHCAQDLHRQPELYLKVAIRLLSSTQECNNAFNYILGFEVFKMLFRMSWLQHERLYSIQKNQEEFLENYIKPIQHTHKVNGIIVPKDEKIFFAKRDYFVKVPKIKERKLIELVMATFTAEAVTNFGFSLIRHPNSMQFDADFIYRPETERIFS